LAHPVAHRASECDTVRQLGAFLKPGRQLAVWPGNGVTRWFAAWMAVKLR